MLCLIEVYYLNVLIQNVLCGDFYLYIQNSELINPIDFLKNIFIAAQIEISIKPQTYVSLGNC